MNIYKNITAAFIAMAFAFLFFLPSCTKYGDGFLSPYIQYSINEFTIVRGRVSSSYSITTDGSSIPLHIKWTHIYDSAGNVVDDMFAKKYPVEVWTSAYDANVDKDYASIRAKRAIDSLPPITVNENSGIISSNSSTLNIPVGTYTMDIQVSNSAGAEELKNIMKLVIIDGKRIEIEPENGNFSSGLLIAGTAGGAGALGGSNNGALFNGLNSPFVQWTAIQFADTPNVFILKITDRNGVPFNPKAGEIAKRPNSGLNPNPPFLQNLEDYAPSTFVTTDTAMTLKYPLAPFPINSLGNGYNMYYRIPSRFVHIDSTSAWSNNIGGGFYQGTSDSHYLGIYTDDKFDYSLRIPMRIQVPGSYELNIKLLNVTHR